MNRPRDFSSRPRARGLSRPHGALLAAGVVGLALAAWATADAWREHRAAAARLGQTVRDTEAVRARARALQGRTAAEDALAAQAILGADAAPARVVARVAELLPGDVRLEGLSLDYGESLEVELRVSARSAASFDVFLDRLQRSPSFTRVLTGDEDRRAGMRTVVRGVYRTGGR
jgi:hypothetical protein